MSLIEKFVAKASGAGDKDVWHDLENPQCDVRIVRATSNIGGHPVVFVDAPAFEHSKLSELQILDLISQCLVKMYSSLLIFLRIDPLLTFYLQLQAKNQTGRHCLHASH